MAARLAAGGTRVAVADVDEETGKESVAALGGAGGIFVHADVTSPESVAEAAARATGELGPVDILVNVAARTSSSRSWIPTRSCGTGSSS